MGIRAIKREYVRPVTKSKRRHVPQFINLNVRDVCQVLREICSPGELEVLDEHFRIGNMVLLPLSFQREYLYRCEIESFRSSSSRLLSGADVSIVCVDFADPVTKPWVICTDRECVLTAKRKLAATITLWEYDPTENFMKIPLAMRKAYSRCMNGDGSIVATFCPHQRYTHHSLRQNRRGSQGVESLIKLPRYSLFAGPTQKIDVVFQTLSPNINHREAEDFLNRIMCRVYQNLLHIKTFNTSMSSQ